MKQQTFTVTSIFWDSDNSPEAENLPETLTVTITAEPGQEAEAVAEVLAELTGFCVHGFIASPA